MSDIVWEDPPAKTRGRHMTGKHARIAAELRSHPGEWAKVATGEVQIAAYIKYARTSTYMPSGSFEAVARNVRQVDGKRVADIYARYVGEVQP